MQQETELRRDVEQSPSHPPLTPPQSAEERLTWLRLLRSPRVGVATFFRLLAEHGNAQDALAALPDVAQAAGVANYRTISEQAAADELRAGEMAGATLIAYGSAHYPCALYDIADPPPLLWVRGNLELLNSDQVALVGGRDASSLGLRMARNLARALGGVGITVTSGLARGVDTEAHLAALETGTLAVMAGGVDVIYPAQNAVLAQDIEEKGLLLSERAMGITPQARDFPRRNRLVSGLSRAVVVVEAAAKSGSLITARNALDQGRDVLAVPGHPFDARAAGCNMLIRDGATLVRNATDVIDALGPARRPAQAAPDHTPRRAPNPAPPPRPLGDIAAVHRLILNRLGPSPLAEDQLIRDLGLTPDELTPALVRLELAGDITRQSGGLISRMN